MGSLVKSEKEMSLVERMRSVKSRAVLLLDTSGSMSGEVEPGLRKIDALREIVKGLPNGPTYSFNSTCIKISRDEIPEPMGGTVMSLALHMIKADGHKKVVVVTDGNVNSFDQEATLSEVSGIELQILYVGPDPMPDFLSTLAQASGGFCSAEDLKNTKELTGKIINLLAPPIPKREIEL